MKKTGANIGKATLIYVIFIVFFNCVFLFAIKNIYKDISYYEILIALLYDNLTTKKLSLWIGGIIFIKKVIESVSLAIFASVIFSYILNRDIKILFPEKIVLRRRTSEESRNKLTIGILVGNPEKKHIYDIKCVVHCVYSKNSGGIKTKNGEVYLSQTVEFIKNYFRFSFDIEKLPKEFWRHYIEKSVDYLDVDRLEVIITGRTAGLGGYFRTFKTYKIQEIVVDTHQPEEYFKSKIKMPFSNNERTKINWSKFTACIEASESEREDIINEIRAYIGCRN